MGYNPKRRKTMKKYLSKTTVSIVLLVLFSVLCVLELLDGLMDPTDVLSFFLVVLAYNHKINTSKRDIPALGVRPRDRYFRIVANIVIGGIFVLGTFVDIVPFDPFSMNMIKISVVIWSLTLLFFSLKEYKEGNKYMKLIHVNLALCIMLGSLFYF